MPISRKATIKRPQRRIVLERMNMESPQPRERECCSKASYKCVLHLFNIYLIMTGIFLLVVGLWIRLHKYKFIPLLTSFIYPIITYILLFTSGLVIIAAGLGYYATIKRNRSLLIFYTFVLLLIFLLLFMIGLISFIYQESVHTELELNLNNTFLTTYGVDMAKTEAIDFLQEKFECCGAVSYQDWQYSIWKKDPEVINIVPDTCCKTITLGCGLRDHPSNINYRGCLDQMEEHLSKNLILLSAVGLGICVMQILGMIFACQFYCKLGE